MAEIKDTIRQMAAVISPNSSEMANINAKQQQADQAADSAIEEATKAATISRTAADAAMTAQTEVSPKILTRTFTPKLDLDPTEINLLWNAGPQAEAKKVEEADKTIEWIAACYKASASCKTCMWFKDIDEYQSEAFDFTVPF